MSRRGIVTVTPELIAQTVFPGASVKVVRIAETVEDLSNGTYSIYCECDQFQEIPEGAQAPRYRGATTRNEDGTFTTEFR